jgi:DNA-binding response OmpR family regulator
MNRSDQAISAMPYTVAIINDALDIVGMLDCLLNVHGFRTVQWRITEHPNGDAEFVVDAPADAVLWDVSLPGSRSWRAFEGVARSREVAQRSIVLTTTNRHLVEGMLDNHGAHVRVITAPYDFDALVAAIVAAVTATPPGSSRAGDPSRGSSLPSHLFPVGEPLRVATSV